MRGVEIKMSLLLNTLLASFERRPKKKEERKTSLFFRHRQRVFAGLEKNS